MEYILGTIGIVASIFLLKYRERMGDMIGEAEWMRKIGGVYMVMVLFALFIFIWSVAAMTHTTHFLFAPVRMILPGLNVAPVPSEF